MKDTRIARFRGLLLCLSLSLLPIAGSTDGLQLDRRTVIGLPQSSDGRGGLAHNIRVVVSAGKIVAVDPTASPVDIDLGRATLTPGWIDTHVHLTWHYNEQGKSVSGGEPVAIAERAAAENARLTLEAGFTTLQSLGAVADQAVRDRAVDGSSAFPRILTTAVRKVVFVMKAAGACADRSLEPSRACC